MSGKYQTCAVDECTLAVTARGHCRKHYLQRWRAGTITQHATRAPYSCPASHAHDTNCYTEHNCRCAECVRNRKNWRQRHTARMKAYGRDHRISPPRTSAEAARNHVRTLMTDGYALERIARAAGVGVGPVGDLIYGRRGKKGGGRPINTLRTDHAKKLLNILHDDIEAGTTPALGTTRRLQALVAIGYQQIDLADRLQVLPTNINGLVLGKRPVIFASTALAVHELYDELSMLPNIGPTSDSARKKAARHGWVSPLAWDDIDNDPEPDLGTRSNPHEIDEIAVELAIAGQPVPLTSAERRTAVTRCHGERLSDARIAARLGIADRTVARIREELNLHTWTSAEQQAGTTQPRSGRKKAA